MPNTWFLSGSGSDEIGDGTLGNPYATFNKCIDISANGDTIIPLDGVYNIENQININKEITIQKLYETDYVYLFGDILIFNIQSNNVIINGLSISAGNYPAINVDTLSDGNTDPIFWTGTVITNCILDYYTISISMTGQFVITNCQFVNYSPTNNIIHIYNTIGNSVIDNNTFEINNVLNYNLISLTKNNGIGDYYDKCNSKSGNLTISNNNITYTYQKFIVHFIYIDYTNQYIFPPSGPDESYNPNIKLSLFIHDNSLVSNFYCGTLYVDQQNNNFFNGIKEIHVFNNTNNNTFYGAVHLGKYLFNQSKLNIDTSDLSRTVFKVYNNNLSLSYPIIKVYDWDASNRPSMKNISNGQLNINEELKTWNNSLIQYPIPITNATTNYRAVLQSEERNDSTYTFIKTIMNTNGHLVFADQLGIGYTFFFVFKQIECTHNVYNNSSILIHHDDPYNFSIVHTNQNNGILGLKTNSNQLIISTDYETDYCKPRIWAIRYNIDNFYDCITPNEGDTSDELLERLFIRYSEKIIYTYYLKIGNSNDSNPSSLGVYEIIGYKGIMSNAAMINQYRTLQYKWGIKSTSVKEFHWDSSNTSSIQDINGDPVIVGNPITRWVDNTSGISFVNAGSYPATLESEVRNGITYNYIKTVSNTDGYIVSESGIIKSNYTMYLVFREDIGTHESNPINVFMNDTTGNLRSYHNDDNYGYIHGDNTYDYQSSSYGIRIWTIKINGNIPYRCVIPSYGATTFGLIKKLNTITNIPTLSVLKLGQSEDNYPSSICLYEVIIYNGLQTDNEIMKQYKLLYNKWKIDNPIIPVKVFNWDTSVDNSILDEYDNPITVGNGITKWIDTVSNTSIVNGGYYRAILESEERNGIPYNYIRTISSSNGYLGTVNPIVNRGCTMYMVFKEADDGYYQSTGSKFLTNYNFKILGSHNSNGTGSINGENINDTIIDINYSPRIWSIRFNLNDTCTYVVPFNGDPTISNLITGTSLIELNSPNILYFGQMDNSMPSSICLYEIRIYDGLHSDSEMLSEYNSLGIKWGIITPS